MVRFETDSCSIIHYIFFLVSSGGLGKCKYSLETFSFHMSKLGVRLSVEKMEGPCTRLSFLGIEIHSLQMVFHLPMTSFRIW